MAEGGQGIFFYGGQGDKYLQHVNKSACLEYYKMGTNSKSDGEVYKEQQSRGPVNFALCEIID